MRFANIISPCKLICDLDLETSLCKGCGRSREEIALWARYSDAQRAFIMTELSERLINLQNNNLNS
jgi:predicted Fe-S protein YdhL (DUF1289 family)